MASRAPEERAVTGRRTSRRVTAVIWDFDGTLADTLVRNLEITRQIVERLLGGSARRFPALADRLQYGRAIHAAANWRQLYVQHFGIPIERTEAAAALWTEFHDNDREIAPLFSGVREAVGGLDGRRQGIVSQNGHDNIRRALEPAGLLDRFAAIVADEDLPFHRQKPEPDGLLHCVEALHAEGTDAGRTESADTILYVGDHPVDVECVRRASLHLSAAGNTWRALSVGVEYGTSGQRRWGTEPDFVARQPADVLQIVEELES